MKKNYKTFYSVFVAIILTSLIFGCSNSPTDPEPQVDEFFTCALDTGDFLIYQGPTHGLTIAGPDTVHWSWVAGGLFMGNSLATVRVRPLMPFPHEDMTEERIIEARARYVNVPFIDEWLEGNPDPTNEEWAEAYQAWFAARAEFTLNLRRQYRDDDREDRVLVVSELAEQANTHDLIVPDSVWFTPEEDNGSGMFDLWMVLKGMPLSPDGTPDEVILMLRPYWDEPEPSPTFSPISREYALDFHHGVNRLFESSAGPLLVDLSNGLSIHTLEDE